MGTQQTASETRLEPEACYRHCRRILDASLDTRFRPRCCRCSVFGGLRSRHRSPRRPRVYREGPRETERIGNKFPDVNALGTSFGAGDLLTRRRHTASCDGEFLRPASGNSWWGSRIAICGQVSTTCPLSRIRAPVPLLRRGAIDLASICSSLGCSCAIGRPSKS